MEINQLNENAKASLKDRTISAIIMAVIAIPSVLLGNWIFFIFSIFISGVAVYEILRAPRNTVKYSPFIWIFTIAMFYSVAYWVVLKCNLTTLFTTNTEGVYWWSFNNAFFEPYEGGNGGVASIGVSTIAVATLVFVYFFFEILHENFKVSDVCYLITMVLFIGLGIQSLMFLRYYPEGLFASYGDKYNYNRLSSSTLLFYVIVITIMTDMGAYFIGIFFGKHKMNERISPKKTWEGFFGGLGFGTLFGILYLVIFALCGYPVLPCFDIREPVNWVYVIVISLILPFVATLGDFTFSAIKRHFEIKDFSNFIKGHGGILDRLDSIISVSIVTSIILIFINNNWSFLK